MFGFSVHGDSWKQYPLGGANNGLTHIGMYSDPTPALLAKAKANNVTLVSVVGAPPPSDWPDAAKRAAWVNATIADMLKRNLTGVSFDFEGNFLTKDQAAGMVALLKGLQEAVTAAVGPRGSVSVCVPGRPGYEMRNYPYAQLAAATDFLFVMSYDMEWWDDYTCKFTGWCSLACCPLPDATKGVQEFLGAKWDVPPRKLVLGLPWYGIRYTRILGVPANEGEVDYSVILAMEGTRSFEPKSFTNIIKCPGICKGVKSGTEVWYDDAKSLAPKYALARDNGLRGVGMWQATSLDYTGTFQAETDAMWAAIMNWKKNGTAGRRNK